MTSPRPLARVLAPALVLLVTACAQVEYSAPKRDGPPFDEAFPDPSVLVTTDDVAATRALLATVQLLEDPARLEQLVTLAEEATSLDTDHILLLTEAVPAPWTYVVGNDGGGATWRIEWFSESGAEDRPVYEELSDRILTIGMSKWSDPGRRALGALLGRARGEDTLVALSEQHLARWDDGSPRALEEILGGMRSSFVTDTFVLEVLVPRDALEGERQWIAIDALAFDSERTEVMTALVERRGAADVPWLLEALRRLSFDSGRMTVVEAAEPRLAACDADQLRDLMTTFSFDSDRGRLLRALSDRVVFSDARDVCRTLKLFSFESDRKEGLETLLGARTLPVRSGDLVEFVALGDFDSTREDILALVEPHLAGTVTAGDLREVLQRFSFDSDRMDVLRLYAGRLAAPSHDDVERLVALFSWESERTEARRILGG